MMQIVSLAGGHESKCLDPLLGPGRQPDGQVSGHGAEMGVSMPATTLVGLLVSTAVGGAGLGICVRHFLGARQRIGTGRRKRQAMMPTMPWRVSRGYKLQAPEPVALVKGDVLSQGA